HVPTLTIHLAAPDKAVGTAIVVCPGGGYGHLSMDREGEQIAEYLNSLGVSAMVLKYRHGAQKYQHPVPLLDAQRAIRLARAHAGEWHIDAKRVGVMGFSAGGHLASTVGTHFDKGDPSASDPIDRESCRPDFLVLCY